MSHNRPYDPPTLAAMLQAHLEQVNELLDMTTAAMTPNNLVAAPSLASGAAALLRERRDALAAVMIAHENDRLTGKVPVFDARP